MCNRRGPAAANCLNAVKQVKTDSENCLHINLKEEEQIILIGRSPNFGDTLMMRE